MARMSEAHRLYHALGQTNPRQIDAEQIAQASIASAPYDICVDLSSRAVEAVADATTVLLALFKSCMERSG